MDIQLKGKRVLVTGGDSGIVEAMALAFADAAIHYTTNEPAAKPLVQTTARAGDVTATTGLVDGGMTDYPSFAHGG